MDSLEARDLPQHIPSRRALRKPEDGSTTVPSSTSTHRAAWISMAKASMLGALALATVVLPVSGVLSPLSAVASPDSENISWSSLQSKVEVSESSSIRTNPVAASRAAVREQVKVDRCLNNNASANGVRTALVTDNEKSRVMWPLPAGRYTFSSPFGMRVNPVLGIYRLHAGVDLAGSLGTRVTSAADGIVLEVGQVSGLGYRVSVFHPDYNVTTVYGHMISGSSGLKVGQKIEAGDVVGRLGSTGNSTGPHVHFEVHEGKGTGQESVVNPVPWMENHKAGHTNQREC